MHAAWPATDRDEIRLAAEEHPAFAPAEHWSRVARAQSAMAEEGIELLLLFDPQSLGYFTGYTSVNLWDFSALVMPVDGEPRVVLWDFEVPRFEVSANLGDLFVYAPHADPIPVLVAALDGFRVGTYATDDWAACIAVADWERVRNHLGTARRLDARPVLWRTRLRKSAAERELLHRSAELTDVAVRAAHEALAEGVSDHELAATMSAALARGGSGTPAIAPVVAVGPRAGIPHSEAAGRRVRAGEPVFVEVGACLSGYTAPIMRTLVVGEPEPQLAALARTATDAVTAAVEAMQIGTSVHEVAERAQRVVDADPTAILFHRYFGYPVGFGGPPSWIERLAFHVHTGNDALLEEGMVFHIPLSLRHRGVRGVGLSQTVEITPSGPRTLSRLPAELWRTL